jgi:hypothetical protein
MISKRWGDPEGLQTARGLEAAGAELALEVSGGRRPGDAPVRRSMDLAPLERSRRIAASLFEKIGRPTAGSISGFVHGLVSL